MSIQEILAHPIVLSVIIGVVGSISRILVQVVSKKFEEIRSYSVIASLLGLGAIGGWIAYLMTGYNPLTIWGLGYLAPDVIEYLSNAYNP